MVTIPFYFVKIAFQLTELFQIETDAVIYTDQFTCYIGTWTRRLKFVAILNAALGLIYTPQNNLRTTSFISLLIITKMRPSSFTIISRTKLESQPYFNQFNMFATCSATKVSMAPTTPDQKDSKKNGNFAPPPPPPPPPHQKKKKNKTKKTMKILCHTQSCKLNLHSSKRHTDMARKKQTLLRG